jgi:hypothetical protein
MNLSRATTTRVKDASGLAVAYVYYEEEPGRRTAANLMTRDEARAGSQPTLTTNSVRAPERRNLLFHQYSTAQLVAGRDLSRQYAKFIDVPVADEHLDRGYRSLIAAAPLGIAPPLSPQAFDL